MVSNNKILIIDSDKDTCRLLQFSLMKDGFEVQCVQSLREGYDVIVSSSPGIIIIDINLADGAGLEALRLIEIIKSIHPGAHVISSSVCNGNNERGKSLDSGASYFVDKPFSGKEIHSIVHRIAS
ncbi:response regulator [Solitalea koreensis]|nr:response regulator [Solitalea koreensis]